MNKSEWMAVPTEAGAMDVLVTTSSKPRGVGLIMLQEIFGVNEAMRRTAQDFADAGYTVATPDLYWRQERRVDLGYGDADRKKGFGLMQALDYAAAVSDIQAAAAWLRQTIKPDRLGVIGFCLGGKLAVMAGAKGGFDAVASFYGVQVDKNLAELAAIEVPLQYHVGERDEHIPHDAVERIRTALEGRNNAQVFVYPQAGHGFFNPSRPEVFDPAAANAARDRAVALFG